MVDDALQHHARDDAQVHFLAACDPFADLGLGELGEEAEFSEVDADRGDRLLVLERVAVDSHHDALAGVDFALVGEGGLGDLALGVVVLDRFDHAAELIDLSEVLVAARLHFVGERLEEPAAAERVDGVGDAGLVGDHLLRAQRHPDGLLGG